MEFFVRPAGTADAEAIAKVQRISWQATYATQLSPESLARIETAWDTSHWRHSLERTDDRAIPLVLDSQETGVAGFGVAGPRRGASDPMLRQFAGEIYLLYLLPSVQGRGYGRALMAAMARVMRARKMTSALVWALASNKPAIGFYQRLDAAILLHSRKAFFGETVNEIALGWHDLETLADMSRNLR